MLDRIQARRVLARHIAEAARQNGGVLPPMSWGPSMGLRLWRFAAGVCAGAAVGVKWNSLFFIAAMGLLTVFWDINARRIVGLNKWGLTALVRDGIPRILPDDWCGSAGVFEHLGGLVPVVECVFPPLGG